MNERQRRFCEFYAASPNAAEAARLAGYSDKTARSQGQRLLTNADILAYIRELQNAAAEGRIASMTQVKAFWSDVMNSTVESTANRLRASELLAKAAGAFVHVPLEEDESDIAGSYDGDDVVIYLPSSERDEEQTPTMYEDDEGKFHRIREK